MPESPSNTEPYAEPTAGELRRGDEPLPGGGMVREITAIADDQVAEADVLHALDPDQVPVGAYKRKLGWQFWLPTGFVLLMVVLALLAPVLESAGIIKDPTDIVTRRNLPPFSSVRGQTFILGSDTLGRDMLSRIIWGARISFIVGFGAIFFGISIGAPIGIIAGYFKNQWRGAVDIGLMSIMYVLLAFPPLLLALLIVTMMDRRDVWIITLALVLVGIPPIALLVRASTLSFTQREFVLAARTIGASHIRVVVKEVFPNVILPIVSFAIIGIAIAITAEGALAFLGLSVQPPTPTWGGMINEGRTALDAGDVWPSLTPCIVMFLTILSLNLAGDRMREYFDVKEGAL